MADSLDVLVGHIESQHIAIRPLHRSHPNSSDYWDGNWITSRISIVVGAFRGTYDADLRAEDFAEFLKGVQALDKTLRGTASFKTMEGQIKMELIGDGKGHIMVEGEAFDTPELGNRLQFRFEIDQTFLPKIGRAQEEVISAFPVLGKPNA